jgi:twitching motility two-component system response regulator PilH
LSRDPMTSAIPVVILTTKSQETDRVWGVRQGARGYLTKPVDERLLLETIRNLLAGSGG